jgi:hypothetical protein
MGILGTNCDLAGEALPFFEINAQKLRYFNQ